MLPRFRRRKLKVLVMGPTPVSLLERLRVQPDDGAWRQLVDIYTPFVRNMLRGYGLVRDDADDMVQEVLAVLVRKLADFHHQGPGTFRCWLRSITVNCLRNYLRTQRSQQAGVPVDCEAVLDQLEDPNNALSRFWNHEHDSYVARRLLEQLQPEFESSTWLAFQRTALMGDATETVAAELKMSTNAVFISKSRVLARLRQLGQGLID